MIDTELTTLELIKLYKSGNKEILETIINKNQNLAYSLVNRYKISKKEEKEDLYQVSLIGLMKAIENFDFSYNVNFSTYAVPIILGEIKKYFRDASLYKMSRNIKDLYYKIEAEKKSYFEKYNEEISIDKLEKILNVDRYDLLLAMESNITPLSLEKEYSSKDSSYTLESTIVDTTENNLINYITLNDSIKHLTNKEKLLIKLKKLIITLKLWE
jgi:RNA polymerase sporulation-specific sigma factor